MTKDRWLDEGLAVLAEEGAPGIRIDRLAARVGLTKGSFFHHFSGVADYRAALLARWEASTAVALGDAPPRETLSGMADRVGDLLDLRLEVAVRAWAFQDTDVAAVLERVDRSRLEALQRVWAGLIADPERARIAALLPHLVVIGASVALPQPDRSDLEKVFGMLAEVVPAVADA